MIVDIYDNSESQPRFKRARLDDSLASLPDKNPIAYFDNETFSDYILSVIPSEEKDKSRNIHVSKFLLASKSNYFYCLFSNPMRESAESTISILLDPGDNIDHFLYLIKLLYDETPESQPEDLLQVLVLADKFGLEDAVEFLVDHIHNGMSFTLLNSYTLLELRHHESLYNRNSVKVKLVEPAKDYIFSEFKDWNKVLEKKMKIFLDMPGDVLLLLLESDNLVIDSENSIFLGAFLWIQAGTTSTPDLNPRLSYVTDIFKRIRFPQMLSFYLLDIIPQIKSSELLPEHHEFLKIIRKISLQYHLEPSRKILLNSTQICGKKLEEITEKFFSRRSRTNQDKITMKCDLLKNLSHTKFHHGYKWTLKLELKTENEVPRQGKVTTMALYGIIECDACITKDFKFYLPVKYSFEILYQERTHRLGPFGWLIEDKSPNVKLLLSAYDIDNPKVDVKLNLWLAGDDEI